ncbi:MAG: hypothetical protein KatS3mg119_0796 [Rhodothalassiaceae bacterium]|nr:MAG: hypothetical protein KatS3mg119_0796 [Rhodothalassiaceae bacterium]
MRGGRRAGSSPGRRQRRLLRDGREVAAEAVRRMFATHGFEHAGNLAFLGLLALFPFLIVLVTLAGLMGQTDAGGEALRLLLQLMPERIAQTLSRPVASAVQHADEAILTGAILFALWVAVDAVEAARLTVIEAFDAWPHAMPWWKRILVDLLLVLLAAVALVTVMSILVALPIVVEEGAALLHLGADFPALARRLQLVAAPLVLGASIHLAYRLFTPRLPVRRAFLPGTLFTLVAVWVAARLFSHFLARAPRYDVIYGSLAGIMLTQIFFFTLAASFIFGAHLNAAVTRHRARFTPRD